MDFLSEKAIIETINDTIWIKPLDYYNLFPRELSKYCLTYIDVPEWKNFDPKIKIVLNGWVIYKEHMNDTGKGSDEWFLQQLTERFKVTDLCSRSIFCKSD